MLVSPRRYGKPLNPYVYHPVSQISLKDGGKISFDEKANNNSFKDFYANLAPNLGNKLPHAPNKISLDSVLAYDKRFSNTENQKFTFSATSEDEVLKLLKDTNPENETLKISFRL